MSSPRKFRVWDGEEMHEPPHEYVWDPREGARRVIDASDGRITCSQSIDGEVLWGTGLTDAEGTEVYEGDILETIWNGGMQGEVVYENGAWVLRYDQFCSDPLNNAVGDPETKRTGGWGTVIGNRYEDPTLLEGSTS